MKVYRVDLAHSEESEFYNECKLLGLIAVPTAFERIVYLVTSDSFRFDLFSKMFYKTRFDYVPDFKDKLLDNCFEVQSHLGN